MLLRFLGTSAGELYPGIWCHCRNCDTARLGSPRDRRQSAALYVTLDPADGAAAEDTAESLLLDFPSEIASQAATHGIDLASLRNMLVTHSHGDHWFPYLLRWRARPAELCAPGVQAPVTIGGPRFTDLPILHVRGNVAVESALRRELGENLEPFGLTYHSVTAGTDFAAGRIAVTPLAANHDVGREEAMHYVLRAEDRTVLYGLDGDTFLTATREAVRALRFDLVILESTYGCGDGRNHRNFARLIEESDWLRREGLMAPSGRIVATHFSPHHCPPHEETADFLRMYSIEAAWDGMEIRL
jgi:phosphoribosyl 1,2-cyclic phosphate phosphodiesterase